ncbi:hypothetical protein [Spirosoma sp. KNUC1025]|uniref:hypothetical protein n=1 Tax=Spirosoma sp. KNUC1025 TaxID=2894082 RepID=UPI003870CAE8|nr:hypothetical protein LN737_13380 [Spirosoma sp. KNUC1025]
MPSTIIVPLLLLLTLLSCSSTTDRSTNASLISSDTVFKDKVFDASIEGPAVSGLNEVTIKAVFQQDTTGLFRIVNEEGGHQINFIWRFVGDSLSIREVYQNQPGVEQSAPHFEAPPTFYAVTQEPYGYFLKGKHEQILLRRAKPN